MTRPAPDKNAHCNICGEQLDYEIGSAQWCELDEDLCIPHRADQIADVAMACLRMKLMGQQT
jgi:hypothetical protein